MTFNKLFTDLVLIVLLLVILVLPVSTVGLLKRPASDSPETSKQVLPASNKRDVKERLRKIDYDRGSVLEGTESTEVSEATGD